MFVLFQAGNNDFGINMTDVKSIQPAGLVQANQDGPQSSVKIEDQTMPLCDLASLFGRAPSPNHANKRLILVDVLGATTALLVDRVEGVVDEGGDQVKSLPPVYKNTVGSLFPKVLRRNDKLVLLLNPAGLPKYNQLADPAPEPERPEELYTALAASEPLEESRAELEPNAVSEQEASALSVDEPTAGNIDEEAIKASQDVAAEALDLSSVLIEEDAEDLSTEVAQAPAEPAAADDEQADASLSDRAASAAASAESELKELTEFGSLECCDDVQPLYSATTEPAMVNPPETLPQTENIPVPDMQPEELLLDQQQEADNVVTPVLIEEPEIVSASTQAVPLESDITSLAGDELEAADDAAVLSAGAVEADDIPVLDLNAAVYDDSAEAAQEVMPVDEDVLDAILETTDPIFSAQLIEAQEEEGAVEYVAPLDDLSLLEEQSLAFSEELSELKTDEEKLMFLDIDEAAVNEINVDMADDGPAPVAEFMLADYMDEVDQDMQELEPAKAIKPSFFGRLFSNLKVRQKRKKAAQRRIINN